MLMPIDSGAHSSEYVHVSKATSLALAYLSFLDEVSTCSTPLQHAAVARLWSSFFRLRARESSHGKICCHYVTLAAFTHLHMRFALPLRCSPLPRRNGRSPLDPPRPCVAWRVKPSCQSSHSAKHRARERSPTGPPSCALSNTAFSNVV